MAGRERQRQGQTPHCTVFTTFNQAITPPVTLVSRACWDGEGEEEAPLELKNMWSMNLWLLPAVHKCRFIWPHVSHRPFVAFNVGQLQVPIPEITERAGQASDQLPAGRMKSGECRRAWNHSALACNGPIALSAIGIGQASKAIRDGCLSDRDCAFREMGSLRRSALRNSPLRHHNPHTITPAPSLLSSEGFELREKKTRKTEA